MLRISDDCAWNTGGEHHRGVHARRRILTRTRLSARRDESGAAAVEFALISLPLVLLVFGIIQFGWFFFQSNAASSSAREVARQLVVGNCWTDGDANGRADYQDFVKRSNGSFNATVSPGAMPTTIGTTVTVTVTGNGKVLPGFYLPTGGQVSTTVEARFEDDTSGTCP
jgi:Flp pilus assembly protein TadG